LRMAAWLSLGMAGRLPGGGGWANPRMRLASAMASWEPGSAAST